LPKALVTGASGFVGPYLIRYLTELGYKVVGGVHGSHAKLPEDCHAVGLDVTDQKALQEILAEAEPDEVYHLAGLTHPASGSVNAFYEVNFVGALSLLEAVRERVPETTVLMVGSAYSYGRVDHPISETEPLKPVNHYGVSKASADLLAYSYALEGFRVVRARPFNHSGPRQSPDFVLPSLVRQFAEIERGLRDPVIHLGNIDSVRDFSDVRDIVRGYHLAVQQGRSGEAYNLGSGRGVSVRELLDMVSQESGTEVEIRIERSRERAYDIPCLLADTGKAQRELGWMVRIPLVQTIREMLKADRHSSVQQT